MQLHDAQTCLLETGAERNCLCILCEWSDTQRMEKQHYSLEILEEAICLDRVLMLHPENSNRALSARQATCVHKSGFRPVLLPRKERRWHRPTGTGTAGIQIKLEITRHVESNYLW